MTETTASIGTTAPVLVLGARGKTGRRVAARLEALGVPVRAASRSTGTRFDFTDRGTWGPALNGAGAVYLVPMNEYVDQAVVEEFVTAAVAAGVRRLVLLSARGMEGRDQPLQEPLERAVRESGTEWTILRPAWFSQNFTEDFFAEPVRAGELALPIGDRREAFVDAEDIAAVAVAALTEDGHGGQVYELSGPEALSFHDVAAMFSEATGREIRYTPVTESEFAELLKAQGMPADLADLSASLMEWAGNPELGDGVRRALGRDPLPFADYVKAAAASGAWDQP